MKKRILAVVLLLLLTFGIVGPSIADSELSVERHFAAPTYYDSYLTIPTGKTFAYYAQNDPLWGGMCYESRNSGKWRPFRDGGCCPTSVAMALRCILTPEELLALSDHYKTPYSLCEDSINRVRCDSRCTRYFITSAADYAKFLPVVMGDFATGNNDRGIVSRSDNVGTGLQFIDALVSIFDLELKKTESIKEAVIAADNGCGVVAFAGRDGAFTGTGHYILLAGADEDYYYFLDPLCREDYSKTDKYGTITVFDQGSVGVKKEKLLDARLYSFIILSKK